MIASLDSDRKKSLCKYIIHTQALNENGWLNRWTDGWLNVRLMNNVAKDKFAIWSFLIYVLPHYWIFRCIFLLQVLRHVFFLRACVYMCLRCGHVSFFHVSNFAWHFRPEKYQQQQPINVTNKRKKSFAWAIKKTTRKKRRKKNTRNDKRISATFRLQWIHSVICAYANFSTQHTLIHPAMNTNCCCCCIAIE